jgi:flagellar basal-body rod modification protein FlgD
MTTTTTTPTSVTTQPTTNSTSSTAQAAGAVGSQELAGNFNTFLTLLTTQLQNQNPLDPLDTNQFTQQLVEFASVEQQVNMNTNLQTLISLQQTSEATSALQFLGTSVTVSGSTATLSNATKSPATWTFSSPSPATANVSITSSTGQTAYSGTVSLNAGNQSFSWNGQGNNGITWPDGTYNMSITATDANGQPVALSTQVQGVVSGVNLSQNPPLLTVGGQNYTISQIQSISR